MASRMTVSISQSELKELESKFMAILVVSSLLHKVEQSVHGLCVVTKEFEQHCGPMMCVSH